jgi:hypothetical protein
MSKHNLKLEIPNENINQAIIQLLIEQNAQLGVIMDLLTQVIALRQDDNLIAVIKDQVKLNNENMERKLFEITARIMSEFGE